MKTAGLGGILGSGSQSEMQRIGVRVLNVALLCASCFFALQLLTRLADRGAERDPELGLRSVVLASGPATGPSQHGRILERNLFGGEIVFEAAAPEPEPVAEDVIATRLPLQLLGTVVVDPEDLSEAVIRNTREDEHMVLRLGDALEFHPDVRVHAIMPRRVLLKSKRGIEELLLEKGKGLPSVAAGPTPAPREAPSARRKRPLRSTAELARNRSANMSSELVDAMDRMAMHFANDLEPAFDSSGKIEGIRAVNITDGGLLAEAGVERDDLIQGVNGVKITTADAAKRVLRDLASCQSMTGMISGPRGERSVEFTPELLKRFDCSD
ncbi:MAG: hypothetical protein GY944_09890 [bacterium]|nr:hypothetical protein [bacterium]